MSAKTREKLGLVAAFLLLWMMPELLGQPAGGWVNRAGLVLQGIVIYRFWLT